MRIRGADGLTLVTLAEEAGVSRPITYDHFGTRPGLLLALYRRLDGSTTRRPPPSRGRTGVAGRRAHR
ncbi:helix-turn-helix domain-containing protein [Streptomyces sp. DSM 44915]|uniref:Helix-turn-helix domain-containing protein n=1 Tax=Streptomyces chisholmiae TaxID=3075540 RepID=A0ABU2JQJ2_9ACTN|nr:helix-turn-helix domain-containing protein [Streptomyces sp. DSM 44915]MDT0267243.1 helix-turn-helix domain-containing protein [Streptomyces sp. DSM 44915]